MCEPTERQRRRFAGGLALLLLTGACNADPAASIRVPAEFRVRTEVVQHQVPAFAATIGGIGNNLITAGSGFEPLVYRNRFTAIADAADRVLVDRDSLSRFDSLREGFYDGADVRIYRIVSGAIKLVREDKVAEGGSHVSGWYPALPANQLVEPSATQFRYRWDDWSRPSAARHFSVIAVDRAGRRSAPAPALKVLSPAKPKQAPVENALVPHRPAALQPAGMPPAAPSGIRARVDHDGMLTLAWDAAAGADLAGYIIVRSDDAPESQHGFFLQLAGTAKTPEQTIRQGDMVIVGKRFATASRRMLANRVWGARNETSQFLPGLVGFFPDEDPARHWALLPHSPGTAVEEPGETFLRLRLGPGVQEALVSYNHSGTGQFWYPVLEKATYRVEVWLRQQGAGSVRFRLAGFHERPPHRIGPTVFDVGREWKKYVAHFTPDVIQSGDTPNAMLLEFSGPATFDIDNFRVYRADTPFLDYLPSELETIRNSGVRTLRTHGFSRTMTKTYDLEQLTHPGGAATGTDRLNTLPQTLRNLRWAGVTPWLQIEYHLSPDEWRGLVEYLAAPYDPVTDTPAAKPWAYKRFRQGQEKPWTDEFEQIHFELSNETWNTLFRPWTFDVMPDPAGGQVSRGRVYGLFQEHVRAVMRSSPHWAAAGLDRKIRWVLGGWGIDNPFSRDAATASPGSDYLTFADYNGGWDSGEGPPVPDAAGLFNTLSTTVQATIPTAEREARSLAAINSGRARPLLAGTYEAGPGYALSGLNGAQVSAEQSRRQERVMKSLAAGTATLDAFLARAYRGYALQNFFALETGMLWKSHARWYHGGQAYPSWKAIALFNTEGTGDLLRTETLRVPTATIRGFDRRTTVDRAPLAAVYATRKGERLNVFVVSRKVPQHPVADDDGFTPVTVELPIRSAKKLTLYRMTGAPNDNNLLSDNVRVERVELPPAAATNRFVVDARTGADARGLPPASTFLYVFEGVTRGAR